MPTFLLLERVGKKVGWLFSKDHGDTMGDHFKRGLIKIFRNYFCSLICKIRLYKDPIDDVITLCLRLVSKIMFFVNNTCIINVIQCKNVL